MADIENNYSRELSSFLDDYNSTSVDVDPVDTSWMQSSSIQNDVNDVFNDSFWNSDSYQFDNISNIGLDVADQTFAQGLINDNYGGLDTNLGFHGLDTDFLFDSVAYYTDDINYSDFNNADEIQSVIDDVLELDSGEVDVLEGLGLIDIDRDGNVANFSSTDAIDYLATETTDNAENYSDAELAEMISLQNELIAAEYTGTEALKVETDGRDWAGNNDASDWIGGQKDSKVVMAGNDLANTISGSRDPNISLTEQRALDYTKNYTPAQLEAGARNTEALLAQNGGRLDINGMPVGYERYAAQGMVFTPKRGETLLGYFDRGTDLLQQGTGLVLKPLNMVTDGLAGGINWLGEKAGDNFLGSGIRNFGGLINKTGDYLFGDGLTSDGQPGARTLNSLIWNVPDDIANTIGGGITGNWDVALDGARGLLGAPVELLGNALSVPMSLAVDTFGADKVSFNATGSGGGGGGGGGSGSSSSRRPPQRKRNPINMVGNKNKNDGRNTQGVKSVGGGTVAYSGQTYDMNTADGQAKLLEKGGVSTLMEALSEAGAENLLSDAQFMAAAPMSMPPGTAPGQGGSNVPLTSTKADSSSLGENFAEKQGGGNKKQVVVKEENIENPIDSHPKALPVPNAPDPKPQQEDKRTSGISFTENDAPSFA